MLKWKHKNLHGMLPNKSPDEPTISTNSNFEIAIMHPIIMMVNKPKPVKSRRHHKVRKDRFIGKTVVCVNVPGTRLVIACNPLLCLPVKGTTTKSTSTAPMIPSFRPSNDNDVTTLAETASHLQLIPIPSHPVKAYNVEACRAQLEIFEHRESQR